MTQQILGSEISEYGWGELDRLYHHGASVGVSSFQMSLIQTGYAQYVDYPASGLSGVRITQRGIDALKTKGQA